MTNKNNIRLPLARRLRQGMSRFLTERDRRRVGEYRADRRRLSKMRRRESPAR